MSTSVEQGAAGDRMIRPRTGPGRAATQFKPKNSGKPKGTLSRRTLLGQAAAQALEAKCWDVLEGLLRSSSWRAREAAVKVTLAYALGLPRQSLTISGGFADLSAELAAALREARLRRDTPALSAPAPEVPVLDAVVVEAPK